MSAAAAEPDLRRSFAGELSALATLFVLTIRQNTHGRRLWVLAFLYALPCALAILIRTVNPQLRPEILENSLIFILLPHGLAPLTALLYSAGVIQDEVEEQTLTYLLMRSMSRRWMYVVKLAATWLVTSTLIGLAVIALYVTIYVGTPEFTSDILPGRMLRAVGIMALGQAGYCAIFGLVGLSTRRSLIAGIAYIVIIESILANIDFVARKLTVVYYVRILILRWLDLPERLVTRFQSEWGLDLKKVPTAMQCTMTLLTVAIVFTLISALWFSRREFRMKTPGE